MKSSPVPERLAAATLVAVLVIAGARAGIAHGGDVRATSSGTWDPNAAASYLDQRATWWVSWKEASREHGTFCVSCHTALPYALARPALHKALAESGPTESERAIWQNATRRVRMWNDLAPLYNDKDYGPNKGAESRATEAVVLTFLLAMHDSQAGKLSDDTRAAFEHLWALQQTSGPSKGAWLWQLFDLNPWEGNISAYNGAAMVAVALGVAPENYRGTPAVQKNIVALRDYLDREYANQPLVNRATLLWASAKFPGVLALDRQQSIIDELSRAQKEDGGWSLFPLTKTWRDWTPSSLVGQWKRKDGSPQDLSSDGFATGLAVFVLGQAGVPRDDARLQRGRAWLVQHQNKTEGLWYTASVNKRRDPASNAGRFMSDAATAYAVLALTE